MKPTVEELKAHIKVENGDEDVLIQSLIDAAYDYAAKHTRRDFSTDYAVELPSPVKTAVLMFAGALYAQREAIATGPQIEAPIGFKLLLEPYRVFPEA